MGDHAVVDDPVVVLSVEQARGLGPVVGADIPRPRGVERNRLGRRRVGGEVLARLGLGGEVLEELDGQVLESERLELR